MPPKEAWRELAHQQDPGLCTKYVRRYYNIIVTEKRARAHSLPVVVRWSTGGQQLITTWYPHGQDACPSHGLNGVIAKQ